MPCIRANGALLRQGESDLRAGFFTLGCKVNQYETESIRERFRGAGFDVDDSEGKPCDVYVINTCTVTNIADRKSRQIIRRAHKLNPDAVIAVTGCYAQMDSGKVSDIEGVDIVTGTDSKRNILELVQEFLAKKKEGTASKVSMIKPYSELTGYEDLGVIEHMDGRTRAFIKVQEGCDRFCSYCVIPMARGHVRSRDMDEIVDEAKGLISSGYKEIVLTGINTALYGKDIGLSGIEPLIAEINKIEGDFRIRLSSLEPTVVDAEYAAGLLKYDKLCHHLHLSAQSGSGRVLEMMNRNYGPDDYLRIVERLRAEDPCYGISCDIIVGFPGETEEDFDESVELVRKARFCKTHIFKYSKRNGTKAAGMSCQIPDDIKQKRSEELKAVSDAVEAGFIGSCLGEKRRVLVEQEESGYLTGYTDNYIKVYLDKDSGAKPGEFVLAELEEVMEGGAKARPIIREI